MASRHCVVAKNSNGIQSLKAGEPLPAGHNHDAKLSLDGTSGTRRPTPLVEQESETE
jgi:hypothetical protein